MIHTIRVLKNSTWLVVQPLILNLISLFVMGYIARTLGNADYGKFTFAFAFVSLFLPIINMGLSSLATREISEKREKAAAFFWKLVMLRLALSTLAFILVVLSINLLNYSNEIRNLVYIAGSTLIFYSIISTFASAFQGFETMEYVAYVNFISGFVLTFFSVFVLFVGYRLIGLTLVYAFGSLLGMLMSIYFIRRVFPKPQFKVDVIFWKENLVRGFPLFIPGIMAMVSMKIGIILLSTISGESAVGVFGAANSLAEKLLVIPDSISMALFPTLAMLYQQSHWEAGILLKQFHLYMALIGLPLAIGTTILAKPIILLIYGDSYLAAAPVLQILIWWILLTFFTSLQGWSLCAAHREKETALISITSGVICISANFLLIPFIGVTGPAVAILLSAVMSLIFSNYLIHRYFTGSIYKNMAYIKIIVANVLMVCVILLLQRYSVFVSIAAGSIVYMIFIFCLKILNIDELKELYESFIN